MPVRWLTPSPILCVERFGSFDEFRPNDVLGRINSTPLHSEPISVSRSVLALPDCLLVMQRSFARRMEGNLGAGRGVGLVVPLAFHATMNGSEVGDTTIGVIRGQAPADVVERHANTYLMLRFGSDMRNRGWADFDDGIELFRLAPGKMLALRSAILDMFCLASDCRDLRQFELLSGHIQETLIAGLDSVFVQDSVRQALPGSFDRHRKLVERLDELVAVAGEADLYSSSLAQTLGVSVRTLQTAVQHVCGVSLHQHLRSKRMWSVRKLLVKGSPLLTVTAAAHANGFWHMSDFARCYGKAYGEMPSETLARARGF
ncbi:helix-turn-helix domain-containing protein [Bradyrhizobium sp. 41S5]|uniref:AraC family transcriptional regulator n=1 Tax=Bradyrhizobium sp. 41S5 TaxID=1404443 RepID=UPI00156B6F71|nr:helix-turn-helix domain-containing protein [Bradyrhizobium sp. 41S5]UFX45962.1 helix-turn-helix domain-containing protein [Bradyrhizobium sp. 41S5]